MNMDESDLFELFKDKVFGDLVDLNKIEGEFCPIDWYVPTQDIWIEGKCRKEVYQTHRIEQHKWSEMTKKENPWYVVQDASGIYIYDLSQMEEPCWRPILMRKSQFTPKQQMVYKSAGDLDPRKAITFDSIFDSICD